MIEKRLYKILEKILRRYKYIMNHFDLIDLWKRLYPTKAKYPFLGISGVFAKIDHKLGN